MGQNHESQYETAESRLPQVQLRSTLQNRRLTPSHIRRHDEVSLLTIAWPDSWDKMETRPARNGRIL